MSFPQIMRRLFQSDGGGEKLKEEIMPATYVKAESQTLTTDQKKVARTNIDAVSDSELKTALSELIVEYGGTVPTESQSL